MVTHKHKYNTDKVSTLREDGRRELLILSSVWVEPNSSAAGSRMLQLIRLFQKANYQITYASTALKSDNAIDLIKLGIDSISIQLNNASFDDFIKKLNPDVVLFDRFMIEEQFGWRVAEILPNALRILDTEDLHCLRKTREIAVKKELKFQEEDLLKSDIAKREIASILRCDLSLIISTYEMKLLKKVFKIDDNLLYYIPFLLNGIKDSQIARLPKFEERNHFYFIGNFLHQPNYDAVLFLKQEIWPLISKQLPKAELHIYGAYPSQKITQLNNVKERFLIKGKLADLNKLKQYRICLAPIRFGAGLKGKLIETMQFGTPNVTTKIGAEGLNSTKNWNGFIENNSDKFSQSAIELFTDKITWKKSQLNGFKIINTFNKQYFETDFIDKLHQLKLNLDQHRTHNFIGELLQYHTLKSTKYLSKWIEEKNKNL